MPTFQTRPLDIEDSVIAFDKLSEPASASSSHWYNFLGYSLIFIAVWTVVIKYLFPIAFAQSAMLHWDTWVTYDLWPLVHAWLGWAMLTGQPFALNSALLISVVEIAIVSLKLAYFFATLEWTIWEANWLINKMFVLGVFVAILVTAWRQPELFPRTFLPIASQVESSMKKERRKDYEADWQQFQDYLGSDWEPAYSRSNSGNEQKGGQREA
ncbi:MAG: hypothetical protein ACPGYX_02495 [Oceanobacter sp.]